LFQDFVHYQFTARENIGFGQIEEVENLGQVTSAARRSGADPIITQLPAGYETTLGRRWNKGLELSGGEWQKVALGRAFMRDAQVLVLDEPTASLDAEAEYEIFKRFGELTKGELPFSSRIVFLLFAWPTELWYSKAGASASWGRMQISLRQTVRMRDCSTCRQKGIAEACSCSAHLHAVIWSLW
jgi:ABC-type cobalamin/Fe3+-siderophores transport system ATPase subunit